MKAYTGIWTDARSRQEGAILAGSWIDPWKMSEP